MTVISGTTTAFEQSVSEKILNVGIYDAEAHGPMAALESITTKRRDWGRGIVYVLLGN